MNNISFGPFRFAFLLCVALIYFQGCSAPEVPKLSIRKGDHIALIGNNLCSRMMAFGYFETELHLRYPTEELYIRNMCDGGDTPGFRPHSSRPTPWAFPGAEKFQKELATKSGSEGTFPDPDQWLSNHQADKIIACFGYNESFEGTAGLENFKAELIAFVQHTLLQQYNGQSAPELILVSPIAFQDLSDQYDLPDGKRENVNLGLYTEAIREVADEYELIFVDAFHPMKKWFNRSTQLTIDGFQLNEEGYEIFAQILADAIFGNEQLVNREKREIVREAVLDKNWYWENDYKIPNGVHVYGRRFEPFGPDNYPFELEKIRQLTSRRDTLIWMANIGAVRDLVFTDGNTLALPPVETNYKPENKKTPKYKYGAEALSTFTMAPGYKIELFASEKEFPDLANPVQLSFDNKGRLWVACMPTYPHYRPGDPKPNDKLLILEDTNGDGQADKQTIFADNLHLPIGFELAPEGVYVSQSSNLKLYTDTNGDDHADKEEILLSGFDDHDTHHAISAFCADPSGALYMAEGVFLHSNIETPYGPVRATNGGFYRYAPQQKKLERTAQLPIPNPWGIAFDDWGQNFFAETSSPDFHWMMPGTIKPRYGVASPLIKNLIEDAQRVRPTSGVEFIHSGHFPDEVQGDFLINNTIGFLGTKQHKIADDSTGYVSNYRQDLLQSDDPNFRPVDLEFAPDGSLYIVDWHNVLIGHMQHNARDPLRDHVHGRIYRVTYPERPLLIPANIADADLDVLFENLKSPEYRTRYRTRRELRGRNVKEGTKKIKTWYQGLNKNAARYEHHLLEALWTSWGWNAVDIELLEILLNSKDHRVRAAAVKVLRYVGHQVNDQSEKLLLAANDPHGRVRLEAMVAASWLEPSEGMAVLDAVQNHPLDEWMLAPLNYAQAHLQDKKFEKDKEQVAPAELSPESRKIFALGKEVYGREGFCATCHLADGNGLAASGFPPLVGTDWVLGDPERLIKLTLKGLHGPMEVLGKSYPGQVPMMAYEGLLNDEEIAAVLTYVRNAFGNKAKSILPETVQAVRNEVKDKKGFYAPKELMINK